MTQRELNRLKEVAKGIGKWAEYGLMEAEYWAPHELDRVTEEVLRNLESNCRKWLSLHKDEYPPSGAEEVLREEITSQLKTKLNCLSEDEASEAEGMRLDGKPLSRILRRFNKAEAEAEVEVEENKPQNYIRDRHETFEECVRGVIKWEKQYLEHFDPPTRGDYLEWALKAKAVWDAEELTRDNVNDVLLEAQFPNYTETLITQSYFNQQKQLAHKIGPWADFIITEVECTAPFEMDRFTENVLRNLEYLCNYSRFDPTSSVDKDELETLIKELIFSMDNSFYSSEIEKTENMRAAGVPIESILKALGKSNKILRPEKQADKAKPNNFLRYVFKDFDTGLDKYIKWKEQWPELDHFPGEGNYIAWTAEFEKLWEKDEL